MNKKAVVRVSKKEELKGVPAMAVSPLKLTHVDKAVPRNSLFEVFPASGSKGVHLGVIPKIDFKQPMLLSTLNEENIMMFDVRGNKVLTKLSVDGGSVSIYPEQELNPGARYYFRVKNVRGADGRKPSTIDNSAFFETETRK